MSSKAEKTMAEAMRCHRAGDLDGAERLYRQVLELDPHRSAALNNLGALFLERGDYAKAASLLKSALKSRSDYPTAQNNLGLALRALGRVDEAIEQFTRALSGQPGWPDALANLGSALQASGNYEEAERNYRRALRLAPDHPPALAGLAELMEWQGRYDEGATMLEQAGVSDAGADPAMLLAYARLERRLGKPGRVIDRLEHTLGKASLPAARKQQFHFTLGDLYDDLADYERAFSHYESGNRLKSSSFDVEAHSRYVDEIIQAFDEATMQSSPRSGSASEEPVFIVGMPRSGTSLVEQILSRHPQVHAGGERSDIGVFASRLIERPEISAAYPAGIRQITNDILSELAMTYLRNNPGDGKAAVRITDKMPLNFQHLGFIELVFPRARVVHCQRDPLDVAVSCYFQDFIDPALSFTSSLRGIAAFYRDYARLMDHWRRVSGLRIHELSYERLVETPEASVCALLEFLGIKQDDACHDFHESGRVTKTASHAQVRQPVYRSAVGRHRNYARFLGPLFPELGKESGVDER